MPDEQDGPSEQALRFPLSAEHEATLRTLGANVLRQSFEVLAEERVIPRSEHRPWIQGGRDYFGHAVETRRPPIEGARGSNPRPVRARVDRRDNGLSVGIRPRSARSCRRLRNVTTAVRLATGASASPLVTIAGEPGNVRSVHPHIQPHVRRSMRIAYRPVALGTGDVAGLEVLCSRVDKWRGRLETNPLLLVARLNRSVAGHRPPSRTGPLCRSRGRAFRRRYFRCRPPSTHAGGGSACHRLMTLATLSTTKGAVRASLGPRPRKRPHARAFAKTISRVSNARSRATWASRSKSRSIVGETFSAEPSSSAPRSQLRRHSGLSRTPLTSIAYCERKASEPPGLPISAATGQTSAWRQRSTQSYRFGSHSRQTQTSHRMTTARLKVLRKFETEASKSISTCAAEGRPSIVNGPPRPHLRNPSLPPTSPADRQSVK